MALERASFFLRVTTVTRSPEFRGNRCRHAEDDRLRLTPCFLGRYWTPRAPYASGKKGSEDGGVGEKLNVCKPC